jgi:hypothetical protein
MERIRTVMPCSYTDACVSEELSDIARMMSIKRKRKYSETILRFL